MFSFYWALLNSSKRFQPQTPQTYHDFMNNSDAFIYWKSNIINVFDFSKATAENENTIVK